MAFRFNAVLRKLGRLEKVFLLFLILSLVARFSAPAGGSALLLAFVTFVVAVLLAFKWLIAGMKRVIWRLRHRLLVAYLFIAVVPIMLILVLVGVGIYVLTGQIAAYLVTTELDRRTATLFDPARGLAWTPANLRTERARWIAPVFWERFPGFQLLIEDDDTWRYPENADLTPPPAGWSDSSGLLEKDGAIYLWAHAIHESTEVTMLAPVTEETFSSLVPNLGDLSLMRRTPGPEPGSTKLTINVRDAARSAERVPPPVSRLDVRIAYAAPVRVAVWNSPGKMENDALFLVTRFSAVLRTIFGQKVEWQEGISMASLASLVFTITVALLLGVELVSVIIGIRLTRTITRAVHGLYVGTQRVREGDFSHRIEVRGNDQLAELSESFNRMTENLERLVEVAKEKERLQSEIEIAREVQNQLFPRSVPEADTLRLTAACRPARLVSGDYYDYMSLEDSKLALAIGDVAGKGISAALLMATVQSTMRTQLRAARGMAAAAGNGGAAQGFSTAVLVSRLNQQLYAYTPPEKYATFYFAIYDDSSGLLTYTNAGHLPPILVRNGSYLRLEVTGTVVGAFDFSQYGESAVRLEPGDLLVCFTDGITEPENEFGEMFGEDHLAEVLVKNSSREPEQIIEAVLEAVHHWTGSPELQDDMTLLLARRI